MKILDLPPFLLLALPPSLSPFGIQMARVKMDARFILFLFFLQTGCQNACEIDAAGVNAPLRDEEEEMCKIPPPVAMSCHRRSLVASARLVCPCV